MEFETSLPEQLRRLVRKADAAAESADAAIRRAIRDIRGELLLLASETDVGRSADAREAAYDSVRRRMRRLEKRLAALLRASVEYASEQAVIGAADATGLDVQYARSRADEIIALVTEEQGENLAAVFTENMERHIIANLRMAVVAAMRENAVAGGSLKDLARMMGEKWQRAAKDGEAYVFVDAGGNPWDSLRYFQMNARTNAMRVYNDCLAANIAEATGSDLVMVTRGGDPHCGGCFPWEGRILSLSGNTEGFPTYDAAKEAGCFHPNCVHTLDGVDKTADADEIALQRDHPVTAEQMADREAMDENRYEIDIDRKMRQRGLKRRAARIAVDRDNLELEIRNGLIREDARAVVDKMTDAQVEALCPNGNPPRFEPVKRVKGGTRAEPKYEPEKRIRGSRGGAVHIRRDATKERIKAVCHLSDAELISSKAAEIEPSRRTDGWKLVADDLVISSVTKRDVRVACGIGITDDRYQVPDNSIAHTFNRHGNRYIDADRTGETQSNHIPMTVKDFERLPETVRDYDRIEHGGWCAAFHCPSVRFVKKYGDGVNYFVFRVFKRQQLVFQTGWKVKP